MKGFGILLIVVGAVVGYFTVLDRESALALDFVEKVPTTSAWAILVGMGLTLILIDVAKGMLDKAPETPKREPRKRPERLKMPSKEEAPLSRSAILAKAHSFSFGNQVRIEVDTAAGVPITVVLEHMAPQAAKRTIEQVAAWISEVPRPPRLQIRFVQCPDGPIPRHRLVTGAIATHLPRSDFKATAHLDNVEVLFFEPDPEWRAIWGR